MYCKLVCNTRTCSNDDRCAATTQQPSPSAAPRAEPSRREGANTAFSKSSLHVPCEGVVARRADPGEAPNRTAAAKLRRRTVAHDASTTEAVCGRLVIDAVNETEHKCGQRCGNRIATVVSVSLKCCSLSGHAPRTVLIREIDGTGGTRLRVRRHVDARRRSQDRTRTPARRRSRWRTCRTCACAANPWRRWRSDRPRPARAPCCARAPSKYIKPLSISFHDRPMRAKNTTNKGGTHRCK